MPESQGELTYRQQAALSALTGAVGNQRCATLDAIQGQVGVATTWAGYFRVVPSATYPNGVDLATLRTVLGELVTLGLAATGTVGGTTYWGLTRPGWTCPLLTS